MAEVLAEMAEWCTQPGAVAYARKAMIYRNLANNTSKLYAGTKEEADKADMKGN
ncbi:hypothetical protein PILCRDRAFT_402 [Piloderma croceum F 1598]|uniref:Uncharacterized protein n=1 Tax=Piloderma croceum (strain F 1598) TaxID=765440 RepID=A0A0C3C0I8_PILCF|nr:hypothetical protein PILCRDRAFT_402 [Piloderma croceum F 1598]